MEVRTEKTRKGAIGDRKEEKEIKIELVLGKGITERFEMGVIGQVLKVVDMTKKIT